ncbi:helix-turn-helix domain-containing protein [Streptomyces sp. NPDC047725]|uniref:helix-turn-helix domain-containing protein n=1 Tax=Streptomyces sp. NPDC047725 TaxID=3365487 RepID=UPI00371ADF4F
MEVSRRLGVSPDAVRTWRRRFLGRGLDDLCDDPRRASAEDHRRGRRARHRQDARGETEERRHKRWSDDGRGPVARSPANIPAGEPPCVDGGGRGP